MRVLVALLLGVTGLSGCVVAEYGYEYYGEPEACWYEHVVYEERYCPPPGAEHCFEEASFYR